MIHGEENESSDNEDSEAIGAQWSALARPPKVLGVDPASQLQVFSESLTMRTSSFVSICQWDALDYVWIPPSALLLRKARILPKEMSDEVIW